MNLEHIDWRAFAREKLATFNTEQLNINKYLALEDFESRLRKSFKSLNSDEVKKKRFEHFSISGTKEDHYQEYWLKLDSGQEIICGIRFMNLNINLPFVELRTSFPIESSNKALTIYQQIRKHFDIFRPKFISFHTSKMISDTQIGNITMVSGVKEVCNQTPWSNENEIELKPCDDYFEWYENEYKKFHELRPDLQRITINEKEIMDDSKNAGLLYEAVKDGERIGLIAGECAHFLGKRGLYFNEIVVKSEFKGMGYAKVIQKKFIEIHRENFDLVFGTIEQINLPSLNTAKANGRMPIRFEHFLSLD